MTREAEERAADWAPLVLHGPDLSDELRMSWANGPVRNPAAPDDIRTGLLGLSDHLMYEPLPTAVVEAALVHPDWKTWQLPAEFQSNITPEQWARLILGERDTRRRWVLIVIAAYRGAELPGAAYEQLAADPSPRVREEDAGLAGLPVRLLVRGRVPLGPVQPRLRSARARARTRPHRRVRTLVRAKFPSGHSVPQAGNAPSLPSSSSPLTTPEYEREHRRAVEAP